MNFRFRSVCVESLGYVLPERVVTSAEIESSLAPLYQRLGLPTGRLELMTGVRERRFFPPGIRPSGIATMAGEHALRQSKVPREAIGALLHTAVCRDFVEPATASVVHHALKLPGSAFVADLSNACLGFLNSMLLVGNMIELGQIKAAVLVSGEDGRELVESTIAALNRDETQTRKSIKSQFASLTIGSAGVAALLCHESIASEPARRRLLGGTLCCATQHHTLCHGDHLGPNATQMWTDSEELLNRGVELAEVTWKRFCADMEWAEPAQRVSKVIGHQVGRAHRQAILERLGLDPAREFASLEFLGNVGSAAAPITLALAAERQFIVPGDTVALLGIGSGINCLMMALQW